VATILGIGLENASVASALALLLLGSGWMLRRRPALRHCLWLLVLIKLVAPPFWRLPITAPREWLGSGEQATVVQTGVSAEALALFSTVDDVAKFIDGGDALSAEGEVFPVRIKLDTSSGGGGGLTSFIEAYGGWVRAVLGTAWICGSLIVVMVSVNRIRRFQQVFSLAKPASEWVCDRVDQVGARIGLWRSPEVVMVPGEVAPMVWALGTRPVVILPAELWGRLDTRQRETLIAHELAHLKRGDHWVRLLELGATVLFWWLPIVWLARRALREAEEQCCDAWVVWAFPGAARAYAESLVETVEFLSGVRSTPPIVASGFGHVHQLKRRLRMILLGSTPRHLGIMGRAGAIGLAAALLPLGPTWAQQPDETVAKPVEVRVEARALDVKGGEPGQPLEVRVVTRAEGDDAASAAMKSAVERLAAQLRELKEQKERTKAQDAKVEALERAIATLKESVPREVLSLDGRRVIIHRRVETKNETADTKSPKADSPDSKEKAAEKEKLRARIGELNAAVKAQNEELGKAQRKLSEAHRALAEATSKLSALEGGQVYRFEHEVRPFVFSTPEGKAIHEYRVVRPSPTPHVGAAVIQLGPQTPAAEQERRLSELEKKLDRVLERLETIQKESARDAGRRP
jgi:beta-lactamase regulating signal transducer with metallopeptidase domain